MEPFLLPIFTFLVGAIAGSFFNVVITRCPRGESLWWPGSKCPRCQKALPLRDNLPLISWLWLKGKCRQCHGKIPARYWWVEFLSACIALAGLTVVLFVPVSWDTAHQPWGFLILAMLSLPITLLDKKHFIIPDVLTLPWLVLGSFLAYSLNDGNRLNLLLNPLLPAVFLWLVGYVSGKLLGKEALGWGDVLLTATIGSLLGWPTALHGIFFGAFLGIAGHFLFREKEKGREDGEAIQEENQREAAIGEAVEGINRDEVAISGEAIPFGPYLCAGSLLACLAPSLI